MEKRYMCPSCNKYYDSLIDVQKCLTSDIEFQKRAEENEKIYDTEIQEIQNDIEKDFKQLEEKLQQYNEKVKLYNKSLKKQKYKEYMIKIYDLKEEQKKLNDKKYSDTLNNLTNMLWGGYFL